MGRLTANVLWPNETATDAQGNVVTNPVARLPDGIDDHYAPLAMTTISAARTGSGTLASFGAAFG